MSCWIQRNKSQSCDTEMHQEQNLCMQLPTAQRLQVHTQLSDESDLVPRTWGQCHRVGAGEGLSVFTELQVTGLRTRGLGLQTQLCL